MMDFPFRIDIQQIDLFSEKIKEPIHLFLILEENYFRYKGEYYCETRVSDEDEALGWEETYSKFDEFFNRKQITTVELRPSKKSNCYIIEMQFSGRGTSLFLYFKLEKEAVRVHQIFTEYFFGIDENVYNNPPEQTNP